MILLNTTFAIDQHIRSEFIAWLKSDYIPTAERHGFSTPLLSQVVTDCLNDDSISLALQMLGTDHQMVDRWFDGDSISLFNQMKVRWPNLALHFSTRLEVIDDKYDTTY